MELIFICAVCIIIGIIIGENSSSSKSRSYENRRRPPKSPPPLKFKKSVRLDESPVQRTNNRDGPVSPKPDIIPKGQSFNGGYQPIKQKGNPEPPPRIP